MKIFEEKNKIENLELKEMSKNMYESLVKVVVDIEKAIIAVDAPMHIDLEQLLIEEKQSEPKNLWGINIWPFKDGQDFIEFDSMINIKPAWNNRTRSVENEIIRNKIIDIINKLVIK